jgi:hypothetical protein
MIQWTKIFKTYIYEKNSPTAVQLVPSLVTTHADS